MNLKRKLMEKELTIGSWLTLAHPTIAEIMAQSGFDWLAVDLEHSSITIREAEELIRVIELCGVTPLVRLTSNDENQIKRIMDSGSGGVIVPMVKNASDASAAVSAVKYPPIGTRGVGLARAQRWGNRFEDYFSWQREEAVVIVQIEHIDAVKEIIDIFETEGVDGFIIGPYDLSASMGIPGQFEHPDFIAAMERVNTAAEKCNKPGGIHVIEPDELQLQQRIDQGYKFIAYSLDVRMLDTACRKGLKNKKVIK